MLKLEPLAVAASVQHASAGARADGRACRDVRLLCAALRCVAAGPTTGGGANCCSLDLLCPMAAHAHSRGRSSSPSEREMQNQSQSGRRPRCGDDSSSRQRQANASVGPSGTAGSHVRDDRPPAANPRKHASHNLALLLRRAPESAIAACGVRA